MKHNLQIHVSREPRNGGIERFGNVPLREKLLTRLLGRRESFVILIPGSGIRTVSITELPEGGALLEQA